MLMSLAKVFDLYEIIYYKIKKTLLWLSVLLRTDREVFRTPPSQSGFFDLKKKTFEHVYL